MPPPSFRTSAMPFRKRLSEHARAISSADKAGRASMWADAFHAAQVQLSPSTDGVHGSAWTYRNTLLDD